MSSPSAASVLGVKLPASFEIKRPQRPHYDLYKLSLSSSDSDDLDDIYEPMTPHHRFIDLPSMVTLPTRSSALYSELDNITKQLRRTREELDAAKRKLNLKNPSRITHYDESDEVLELIRPKIDDPRSEVTRAGSMTFGMPSICTSPKTEERAELVKDTDDIFLAVSSVGSLSITGAAAKRASPVGRSCSCLLKKTLTTHAKDCVFIDCYKTPKARRQRPSVLQAVVVIQRAYRRYLKRKHSYTQISQSPLLPPPPTLPQPPSKPATAVLPKKNPPINRAQSLAEINTITTTTKQDRRPKLSLSMAQVGGSRVAEATKVFMGRKQMK
jgi:hypothetical protein